MTYADYTMSKAAKAFWLEYDRRPLFEGVPPADVPPWLPEQLARNVGMSPLTEKARSELYVMPVLNAVRLTNREVALYSGVTFDVDATRGLTGVADYLIGRGYPDPAVAPPLAAVVEATPNDNNGGYGRLVAQVYAVRQYNDRDGVATARVIGCVTDGELWQFIQLIGQTVTLDTRTYFPSDLPALLGVFAHALADRGEPR